MKTGYIIHSIPLIIIFLYGKYRCKNTNFKDPLEHKVLELDGWSMTHVTWFTIVGYLYPENITASFVIGVLWEIFEHLYGKKRPGWLGGYGDCENLQSDKNDDGNWWYGKWSDLLCNLCGLLLGSYIKTKKLI